MKILTPSGNYALGVVAIPPDGGPINPEGLAHTYTYNSDKTLATDTCTDGVKSWTKTFTYNAGTLAAETDWVPQ